MVAKKLNYDDVLKLKNAPMSKSKSYFNTQSNEPKSYKGINLTSYGTGGGLGTLGSSNIGFKQRGGFNLEANVAARRESMYSSQ